MKKCFEQLDTLAKTDTSMETAVENVKKDCRSADQPNGNIPPTAGEMMSGVCGKFADTQTEHLEKTVKDHRAISKPGLFHPVSLAQAEPLRRVVSLNSFVGYHMLESFRGKNLVGMSYDKRTSAQFLKRDFLAKFKNDTVELEMDELQGTTGRPEEPTWWTFYEKTCDAPKTGENYMHELALGENEIETAEQDNIVVELSIDAETLGEPLFKPTALDSFIPDTKFEPELTGKTCGYTVPQNPGLQSRPELVSSSVSYRQLNVNTTLTVKKIPYQIKQ